MPVVMQMEMKRIQLWLEPRDGETLDGNGDLQGLVKDPTEEDSKYNMDSDNEDEDIEEDEDEDKYAV
jgi:hypothetical protein